MWAQGGSQGLPLQLLCLPTLQQSLLTMEEIQSVEETQIKERKCLLLKIRGGKQFVLQCDVSGVTGVRLGYLACRG